MHQNITIAAVQMSANPSPVPERLARANQLISSAVSQGAQIVVLPELFNTGYEYSDKNYSRAEKIDGSTVSWMKNIAKIYDIHLAGSLLLWDQGNIFNTMLITAPDGKDWRYYKNYPWVWERAYFCSGNKITVADTSLGKFGMLICWDIAHPQLIAKYSDNVDAILITSCPPAIYNLKLRLPTGNVLSLKGSRSIFGFSSKYSEDTFGSLVLRQSTTLDIPIVNTSCSGVFSSKVPMPYLSMLFLLPLNRNFMKYYSQASSVILESGYFPETYIANASGQILGKVPPDIESYTVATIDLSKTSKPVANKLPNFGLSPLTYWIDSFANMLLASHYRRRIRKYRQSPFQG
jgi:hypothetical protein